MSKKQKIVLGASITAGLAGILTTMFLSKKSSSSWLDEVSSMQIEKENHHEKFFLGGLAGGLAGVLLSLLFAPQSGKDLVKSISRHLKSTEKKVTKAVRPSKIKRSSSSAKKKMANSVTFTIKKSKKALRKKNLAKKREPSKKTPIEEAVTDAI